MKPFHEDFPPKGILAPVDFSECSMAGLETAKRLAKKWDCRLEVIHINESTPASLCQNDNLPAEKAALNRYFQKIESRLRDAVWDYPAAAIRVVEGFAKEEIGKLVSDPKHDLVVMGTHSRRRLARFVLGSVTESTIHQSRIPVLAVHPKTGEDWPRHVLIPMKYEDYANAGLLYGVGFAKSLGASITIVHAETQEDGRVEAERALSAHIEGLLDPALYSQTKRAFYVGDPAECVIKAAELLEADLIVLTARKKTFLENLILGKTAERILRYAPAAVLAVPSWQEAKTQVEDELLEREALKCVRR